MDLLEGFLKGLATLLIIYTPIFLIVYLKYAFVIGSTNMFNMTVSQREEIIILSVLFFIPFLPYYFIKRFF
jgi:hypothetical protein